MPLGGVLFRIQTGRHRWPETQGSLIEHVDELPDSKFVEFHVAHPLEAERGSIFQLDRAQGILCLPILDREGGLSGVVRLLTKRGGPFTAEDAARLQKFLRPLGTILDACCRLAHLGRA